MSCEKSNIFLSDWICEGLRIVLQKSLKRITRPIFDDIKLFEEELKSALHSEVRLINMIGKYIIHHKGKLIRPILTILSSRVCGQPSLNSYKAAAMIELLHIATLIHDDVVDESSLRRGLASANAVWGNQASVLVGDFLFSRSFELMVSDGSLDVLAVLSRASSVIAEGEVLQLTTTNDTKTGETRYLEVIQAKTAQLFSAACKIGALVADRPKVEEDIPEVYLLENL